MCHVQRVINTCGHRNDHVSLSCRFAKAGHNLAMPISESNSNLSHTATTRRMSTCMSASAATITTTTTITTIATNTTTTNPTAASSSDDSNDSAMSSTGASTVIQPHGFHAYTDPYCIYATVRTLDSPAGFMCMVEGCGRAD
ncbi:uncharacterized protein EURHEDRAFT_375228 [Aspergillus ruber CBS 135680]|uniref:Uncharacterized protein n=1 Tax=Aspergillus ruber (strain CBS 135680) TaxID=1388766 RepID=A0A017SMT4_ASPRC|nr:uncharacterized protein EURHEDRAFT_375228 [Aspergillus ruber CBS 135680]EYE98277.1 hypothetical protein EURHEDRAFT_375228 [Aspergillus ruber CBS 135680]